MNTETNPPHPGPLPTGEGEKPARSAEDIAREQRNFCLDADHDAGFKDVEIEFRSGVKQTIRVRAVTHREQQALGVLLYSGANLEARLLAQCLPQGTQADLLDKLTPHSAVSLTHTAFALGFGEDMTRQLLEAGGDVRNLLAMLTRAACGVASAAEQSEAKPDA